MSRTARWQNASTADALKQRCPGCLNQPVWFMRTLLFLPGDVRTVSAFRNGVLSDVTATRLAINRARKERARKTGRLLRDYRFSPVFRAWLDLTGSWTITEFVDRVTKGAAPPDPLVRELDEALCLLDAFFVQFTAVRLAHRKARRARAQPALFEAAG